jgi:hypothetical protein
MSFKWPHFENIHRYVSNSAYPDSLFNEQVCITEKIDGSNLSIHLEKENGLWVVEQLIGRNVPIWNKTNQNTYENLSYGSAGNMGKLPSTMKDFAIRVAEKINTDQILITGEVFRANSNFVSWHPFGYTTEITKKKELNKTTSDLTTGENQLVEDTQSEKKTKPDENSTHIRKIFFLTLDTYKLFAECSQTVTQDQFQNILIGAKDYLIFPPPLLYTGKLSDGIQELYVLMHRLTKDFEGSFIVFEKLSDGCKWKTGFHDEQMRIVQAENIPFTTGEAVQSYTKLIDIYKNKPHKKSTGEKKTINEKPSDGQQFSSDVITAYRRELSKTEPICHTPIDKREDLIKNFTQLVIKEITTKYQESNLPIPYSADLLEKKTGQILSSLIKKEPYKPHN